MFRKWGAVVAVALLLGLFSVSPSLAQSGRAPGLRGDAAVTEAWRLVDQASAILRGGKAGDLAPLTPALEKALAQHNAPLTAADKPVLLYDGLADQLMIQLWLKMPEAQTIASRKPGLSQDPYPQIAYILGFYYNDIGQPDQALRALNTGVASLQSHMEPNLVGSAPLLQGEIGASHNVARRWQEAHDTYKAALSLPGKGFQAQMYRGMGFSLIEMNRLDDAAAAYDQSLKLEPDNALAKREVAYIAQLRGGGPQQAPTLFTIPPAPAAK